MKDISFYKGEKKYLIFEVTSKTKQTVIITSATWEIQKNDEIIQQGICEIDGPKMQMLLEINERGMYLLELTYQIAPETRKVRGIINVS